MQRKPWISALLPTAALFAVSLTAACDEQPEPPAEAAEVAQTPRMGPKPDVGPDAPEKSDDGMRELHEEMLRQATMPEAKIAFEEVVALIEAEYVDGDITQDQLYTAALRGVMDGLIQVPGSHVKINTLMTPRELEELHAGTSGSVVGIGVAIELVADIVVVKHVLPDGPAAKAGIEPGDRILGIDGQRIAGSTLIDVVDKIRGQEGTEVKLFVQRDTDEWDETLTRGTIQMPSVQARALEGGVGLIRITSFSENTVESIKGALADLEGRGVDRLVVDLRKCPGGLLDAGLAVTSLFLNEGQRIVSMRGREAEEKVYEAEGEHPWGDKPVAILIGPHTASGAEIFAAALAHHDRATLIGEPTMGKGTVEGVHKLDNGWAVKMSKMRFFSPDGEARHGNPVQPQFLVSGDGGPVHMPLDQLDPRTDAQLRAAIEVLAD